MGLFNKKKDDRATGGLEVPNNHLATKSEASTAVPSQNVSDAESEKSRDLETVVIDEEKDTRSTHDNTATTTEKDTVSSAAAEVLSPETKAKAEPEVQIQRTISNSVISVPGAEDDDELVYPSGLKLALITLALCLSVFLVALDNTIIATAIPKITDHFKSLGDVGWYGSSYLLTTCALQLFFGKSVISPSSIQDVC